MLYEPRVPSAGILESTKEDQPSEPCATNSIGGLDWHVAYTLSRHEKKIASHLELRTIEYFLPLFRSVHRWKKRSAMVLEPIFPGYIFLRVPHIQRNRVLDVPGIVRFVGCGRNPAILADNEVEALRNALTGERRAVPHPYFTQGKRVRIASGPLSGLVGTVQRAKGSFRFVITVEMIMRSVAIEVDESDLRIA